MDRLLVACACATLVGLVILGGIAHAHEPRPIPFERLARFEGQRVCVEAELAHLRPVDAGAHLRFVQGQASLASFARFAPDAVPGDRVIACGSLETNAGQLRLRLERPADVRVTEGYDSHDTPLPLLVEAPWDHVDRFVLVHGVVERDGARLWLVDPTTRARIPLSSGQDVEESWPYRVRAQVTYDEASSSFRLAVLEAVPV